MVTTLRQTATTMDPRIQNMRVIVEALQDMKLTTSNTSPNNCLETIRTRLNLLDENKSHEAADAKEALELMLDVIRDGTKALLNTGTKPPALPSIAADSWEIKREMKYEEGHTPAAEGIRSGASR